MTFSESSVYCVVVRRDGQHGKDDKNVGKDLHGLLYSSVLV